MLRALTGAALVTLVGAVTAEPLALTAERVFDGHRLHERAAVLIENGRVIALGPRDDVIPADAELIDIGDATLLPGFIELHAHLIFAGVPGDDVLHHGITTVRDLGGPFSASKAGGPRLLSTGPIIAAPGAYPAVLMGEEGLVRTVTDASSARAAVDELAAGGAVAIKVALEPGGESGAPWCRHDEMHLAPIAHHAGPKPRWPMLDRDTLDAIVERAHGHGLKVVAHVGEPRGARLALDAGIDEWAHVPCAALDADLIADAGRHALPIVGTLDTLSGCADAGANAVRLAAAGAVLLYGAEIGHRDVPRGIDAEELARLAAAAGLSPYAAITRATSEAGSHLGIPGLGTLSRGAPADVIGVRGDPGLDFKTLEYPVLVVVSGTVVVAP